MEKKVFFVLTVLVAAVLLLSGCTQQALGNGNQPNPPFGNDRNFSRACTTDTDCVQQQGQRTGAPRDFNSFNRTAGDYCNGDENCLQRMKDFNGQAAPQDFNRQGPSGDFNRQRMPSEFKCVSGFCKPVFSGGNETQ